MSVAGSALAHLRAATATLHRDLDGALNVIDRLAAPGGAAALLPRYYALHAIAEPGIAALLPASPPGRAAAIGAGLRALHLPTPALPPHGFSLGTAEAAWGALYVMEGSSLGGRMILRELQARGVPTTGLDFLDPYGAEGGAHWRGLLAELETALPGELAREAACAGARAAFALACACLCHGLPALSHAA